MPCASSCSLHGLGAYQVGLKCAHLSPTWYAPKPWRLQEEAQGKSCLVVEKRAEKVAAEYVRKAQQTAQAYCNTAPGTVGDDDDYCQLHSHFRKTPQYDPLFHITLSTQAA